MEVVNWSPAAKEAIESKVGGREVFLVAATLRPETMLALFISFAESSYPFTCKGMDSQTASLGQRSSIACLPPTTVFLCTTRAARNMAFQGTFTPRAQVNQLAEVHGADLVGIKIKAPFSIHRPEVYVLPMENLFALNMH